MGLVLWKNKEGLKSWQAEGFGDVNKQWTRAHPKDEPIMTGVAPDVPEDEQPNTPAK